MKDGRKRRIAGLALQEGSLCYAGLDGTAEGLAVRLERVSLAEASQEALEEALHDLRRRLGGFACPVVLGIPSREVTFKLVHYPRMPVSDVRDALPLEFESYFPYPWEEAVADVSEVDVPAGGAGMTVLAAASRRVYIEGILRVTDRTGLSVCAIEPVSVAFFRAAAGRTAREGAYLAVHVEPRRADVILGYRDNGIFYRSLPDGPGRGAVNTETALASIVRGIQDTEAFVRHQYKGLELGSLLLGGDGESAARLKELLGAETALEVIPSGLCPSWRVQAGPGEALGFEAAIGLALREET